VRVHKGVDLYYFPKVRMGTIEEFCESVQTDKNKMTTSAACDSFRQTITDVEWCVTTQSQTKDPAGSSSDDSEARLAICQAENGKLITAAQKTLGAVAGWPSSPLLKMVSDQLSESMQAMHFQHVDMQFVLRFKKTKAGAALSPIVAQGIIDAIETRAAAVSDALKACKALAPKLKAEPE